MPPHPRTCRRVAALAALLVLAAGAAGLGGCAGAGSPRPVSRTWLAGQIEPLFDPDGPPDALRWALERLLSRGLVEEDTSGRIVPAAAERVEVGPDGLTYTFHLRPGLSFSDGARCGSEDFRRALEAGLVRTDHSTRVWLLGALRGVSEVRAGRVLPALGIETPDQGTLVLRLARPDSLLLHKLALPGVATPWRRRDPGLAWERVVGLGPYRVSGAEAGRWLTLARTGRDTTRTEPDTLAVRFVPGPVRARTLLRAGAADLVWPLPPGLLGPPLPPGYRLAAHPARPERRLLLVMRLDLPPTLRLAARRALAHAVNRGELLDSFAGRGRAVHSWLPGAPEAADLPWLDAREVAAWMERGKLGRSFHVVMAYASDGLGADLARLLQGGWARFGIYVELKPLHGAAWSAVRLGATGAHLLLLESQDLLDDPVADLATLVMPYRGPAVGAFRTGWRTREFDPWLAPWRPAPPLDLGWVQRRLGEETVALPLIGLRWEWVERDDGPPVLLHPHFGPRCAVSVAAGPRGQAAPRESR